MSDFNKIRQWAIDRNLTSSTPNAQFDKLYEEVWELSDSIDAGFPRDDYQDAIGDCVVVLTIMAQLRGHKIEDCIAHAYEQIKDRKGNLVNGIFVKEA